MLIHEKLLAIQKEISFIGKSKKNTMQNFNYRGVDDVYKAFHPLFVKHGILCRSEILKEHQIEFEKGQGKFKSGRVYIIRYYFVADDGSEYWTDVAGEGVDDSDKASNKAMSAGHKYAILQAFTVPTESYDDPDAHGEETSATVEDEAYLQDSASMNELAARWSEVGKRHRGNDLAFLNGVKDEMKGKLS